ncbi:MAG TPA: iron-containing alcohol dehydrogenase [Spirochaetia bacterium]|nr:iron-containing alcohol dehydrogenase [Spirochaetia bacterium]
MDELTFHVPTTVHFGLDLLNRVGQVASPYGKRAFLTADSVLNEERVVQSITGFLKRAGVESIIFDELGPNSTTTSIEKGLALCRASRSDLVIGVGGIRALSCAKCIARLAPIDAPFDDYFSGNHSAEEANRSLPYIEIPTTCRDPFMLTDDCVVVDSRNRRSHVYSIGKIADAAIIDPVLTLSLSDHYTVSTMLDTLLSAIESYFSRRSTFLSETLSLRAVGVITSIIDELAAHSDDRNLRFQASQAGLLVSLSLTMSTQGVGTAVAYSIGGKKMVPKSTVATVMIPHILDLGLRSQPKKVERIGNVLGEEIYGKPLKEFSVRVVDAVRQRMGLLQVPMRLKELDLELDDMVEISNIAHELPAAHFLSEPISAEDIFALIKQAF